MTSISWENTEIYLQIAPKVEPVSQIWDPIWKARPLFYWNRILLGPFRPCSRLECFHMSWRAFQFLLNPLHITKLCSQTPFRFQKREDALVSSMFDRGTIIDLSAGHLGSICDLLGQFGPLWTLLVLLITFLLGHWCLECGKPGIIAIFF